MAAAGYGVVLAPKSMASLYIGNIGNLVCRPIRGYDGVAELAVAYRSGGARKPWRRLFAQPLSAPLAPERQNRSQPRRQGVP